ncbi:MAG: NADH-quinone oxidoreductase subunit J [candidate division NC10 bacterium]|nr:NADH-quinone oxidoreductase subunit J [candidate division NC10 bacterium]
MELVGMEPILFAGLALVAGVSGLLVVVQRHAVYSALYLIITMGSLAGLYILLEAHFVWAVQVLVYAGAIMVLFIFVIMLLNVPREDVPWAPRDLRRIMLALVLAGILLVELILVVGVRLAPGAKAPAVAAGFGTTEMVGRLLFSRFLFPFEITSVILLVAIVGALVLAKKHFS